MSSYLLMTESGELASRSIRLTNREPCIIGRAQDAHFNLKDEDNRVSRYHAIFEVVVGGVRVCDLQSSNGTYVNGVRVATATLRPGDRVRVGRTILVLSVLQAEAPSVGPSGGGADAADITKQRSSGEHAELAALKAGRCAICQRGDLPVASFERFVGADCICDDCTFERRQVGDDHPLALGGFELVREIGSGATTVVYEARHRESGARVAVKRLVASGNAGSWLIRRFLKEQRTAMKLLHPRIVRCFEVGQDRRCKDLYIAMEWLPGGDASGVRAAADDMREALLLGSDLFEALAYIHALGLVHRDVKPANLLLTDGVRGRRRGRLSDFGIIKNLRETTGMTNENEAWGTPLYMAPEQICGFKQVGPEVDIYAGAATLYYMLTGSTPLVLPAGVVPSSAEAFMASRDHRRVSLAERRPDASPALEWVDRALMRDPSARAGMTAGEIADRLRRLALTLGPAPVRG